MATAEQFSKDPLRGREHRTARLSVTDRRAVPKGTVSTVLYQCRVRLCKPTSGASRTGGARFKERGGRW